MKRAIVAIKDRASNGFGQPFFVAAIGQAIRSFQDEINRAAPDNDLNKHPDDFDLYQLGIFDDDTGSIEVMTPPMQIGIGKNFVRG